ncbi:CBS domain-containing protein [Actinomadura madurae]|uniref:CBS domain-containing protein n=1 Tax=Actinomadura madurae TaxID=1993 RepID=UPI0027E30E6A|nr:CBS domain-containing protein [Actinomadura madurae]
MPIVGYVAGVRARDLAVEYPTVTPESSALDAARLLAGHRLPGLLVVDAENRPVAVIPGSQLLRYTIPHHVRDDPALARVYDERHADQLCSRLAGQARHRSAGRGAHAAPRGRRGRHRHGDRQRHGGGPQPRGGGVRRGRPHRRPHDRRHHRVPPPRPPAPGRSPDPA